MASVTFRALTHWRCIIVAAFFGTLFLTLKAPVALLLSESMAKAVADVVKDIRVSLTGCNTQHSPDLLQVHSE